MTDLGEGVGVDWLFHGDAVQTATSWLAAAGGAAQRITGLTLGEAGFPETHVPGPPVSRGLIDQSEANKFQVFLHPDVSFMTCFEPKIFAFQRLDTSLPLLHSAMHLTLVLSKQGIQPRPVQPLLHFHPT